MRLLAPLLISALLAASCGVSRDGPLAAGDPDTLGSTAASGDSSDVDGDGDATTATTTEPVVTAPTTTAPAADVAGTIVLADGTSIEVLHGPVNDIVVPTTSNDEFVTLVYQGEVPEGFDAIVLSQTILGTVIDNELAKIDVATTEANQDEAKSLLMVQLQQALFASPDPEADALRLYDEVPYLPFIVDLQARQLALTDGLAATAPEGEGDPCARHILLASEAEADEVLAQLDDGADFATLAAEVSIGPSAPSGGDLGCSPASNYVPEFAAAVESADVGAFVGPVQTEFGWHVILVESFQVDATLLAREAVNAGLADAAIEVDARVGTWDPDQLTVVPDA